MKTLWKKNQEKDFFIKSLEFASPEQLFYTTNDDRLFAYWPKKYRGTKTTLQSRNSLIGSYAEKWVANLFKDFAENIGGYAISGAICEEIELTTNSPADVAICKKKNLIQNPKDIIMIIEVKMSIVWNWELIFSQKGNIELICLGDYGTHQGNPGLLRSDTMLKAIGKSINIRVSSFEASNIPIIIIGNTPITKSYYAKVDHLKINGIIQGFWSINPIPIENDKENIKRTSLKGFYRFDDYNELEKESFALLKEEKEFFSSMKTKRRLGEIIEIANKESTYENKAMKFLDLLKKPEE